MTSIRSSVDPSIPPIQPTYQIAKPTTPPKEAPATQALIDHLGLQSHVEGGYFVETDRDVLKVPNPFPSHSPSDKNDNDDDAHRNASTTIHYLLTPLQPLGHFHRNKGRTIHTLHSGRGRYILIHADEVDPKQPLQRARIETFIVGHDVSKGEKIQWIVDGGKYKASFLLPNAEGKEEGLLISETVVPGFEFRDHDFLREERFGELVSEEQGSELGWLVRRE